MRASVIRARFNSFFADITKYSDLLVKVIEAKEVVMSPVAKKEVPSRILVSEKREIHEAFVLKIYVAWEVLGEDVFVECLYRDSSRYAQERTVVLPRRLSRNVCRCLISGLGYFDFRDTGDLKGQARSILVDWHNPFEKVLPNTKIDEFYKIRNYVAHRSYRSRQFLLRMYKGRYGLGFREPGEFLVETTGSGEGRAWRKQTRFADYTNAFIDVAKEMAVFLGV